MKRTALFASLTFDLPSDECTGPDQTRGTSVANGPGQRRRRQDHDEPRTVK